MTDECRPEGCIALFEKLSDYIDNDLDTVTCQDIERHAAECPACRVCLATFRRTIDLCRSMGDNPVPPSFSDRLQEAVAALYRTAPQPVATKR